MAEIQMLLNESYQFVRDRRPLTGWKESNADYLRRRFPRATQEQIDQYLSDTISEEMKSPMVTFRHYEEEGRPVVKSLPLHVFWTRMVGNNIFTPSGSVYMRPEVSCEFEPAALRLGRCPARSWMYQRQVYPETEQEPTDPYQVLLA